MNKHEQLIREIADEMAKDDYSRIYNHDRSGVSYRELPEWAKTSLLNKVMPYALIAVKHMADAVDKALRYAEWRKYDERQAYLCFQGLIPEAGNTDKKTNTMADTIAEVAAIRDYDEEMYRKTGKTYLQRIKEEQDAGKEDYQNEQ